MLTLFYAILKSTNGSIQGYLTLAALQQSSIITDHEQTLIRRAKPTLRMKTPPGAVGVNSVSHSAWTQCVQAAKSHRWASLRREIA